jgi:ABC-type phosphate transport system permease subunit
VEIRENESVSSAPITFKLSRKRQTTNTAMKGFFLSAAATTFIITLLIIYTLVNDAWRFFIDVPKDALWSLGWFPRRDFFDIKTLIMIIEDSAALISELRPRRPLFSDDSQLQMKFDNSDY